MLNRLAYQHDLVQSTLESLPGERVRARLVSLDVLTRRIEQFLRVRFGSNWRQLDFTENAYPDDPKNEEKLVGFANDALRASLNEDHFLFFMARYTDADFPINEETQAVFEKLLAMDGFKTFYAKHENFLKKATPRKIIYKTQWAQRGWDEPEEVLRAMEKEWEAGG